MNEFKKNYEVFTMEGITAYLKVLGTHIHKKKCCYVLVIYIICVITYYFIFYQEDCDSSCCHVHSIEALNLYKSFQNEVETSFNDSYFKNKVFFPESHHMNCSGWFEIPDQIFIYSAYLDSCQSTFLSSYCIKFVGAISNSVPELGATVSPIKCAFKYNSSIILKHGFAVVKKAPEGHRKHFNAALFFCSLFEMNDESQWPEYASLYQYDKNLIWLPVHVRAPIAKIPPSSNSISLCVRPLYGFISAVVLGEFLAYYSVMGVDHFIFYNQKLLGTGYSFLNSIHTANISIELLPWNIPFQEGEIHEYGQIVFSQDCVARSRHVFSHTLIVDIDEFLVPKIHKNLKLLVSDLDNTYPQGGSYLLLMSLFCDEYPIETMKDPPLKILTQNKRQKSVWKPWFRSKYIVKPDRVQMVGVHYVWLHENGMKEVVLPDSSALLHHYKPCCYGRQTWFFDLFSYPVLRDKIIEDDSLLHFEKLITSNVVIQFLLHPDKFFTLNRTINPANEM